MRGLKSCNPSRQGSAGGFAIGGSGQDPVLEGPEDLAELHLHLRARLDLLEDDHPAIFEHVPDLLSDSRLKLGKRRLTLEVDQSMADLVNDVVRTRLSQLARQVERKFRLVVA